MATQLDMDALMNEALRKVKTKKRKTKKKPRSQDATKALITGEIELEGAFNAVVFVWEHRRSQPEAMEFTLVGDMDVKVTPLDLRVKYAEELLSMDWRLRQILKADKETWSDETEKLCRLILQEMFFARMRLFKGVAFEFRDWIDTGNMHVLAAEMTTMTENLHRVFEHKRFKRFIGHVGKMWDMWIEARKRFELEGKKEYDHLLVS